MDKNAIGCLEIASSAVRLLIGYELSGHPVVIFATEKPAKDLLDGDKIDLAELSSLLGSLHTIVDDDRHLRITLTTVNLLLPSAGLKVFTDEKSTAIVNPEFGVDKIDVTNVISLVTQQSLPSGLSLVDAIPDQFILDDGSVYANPPLGKKTRSLEVMAKVHCLPTDVKELYNKAILAAGFRVNKQCVSAYAASRLLQTYDDLPKTYILLDIGAKTSTVSFIGEGSPYNSLYFYCGGQDLTQSIAKDLGLPEEEAESLKIRRGYDPRENSYSPALSSLCSATQADLNKSIEGFFGDYGRRLSNAVETLMSAYRGPEFASLPVVRIGGGSKLRGLAEFLQKALPGREIVPIIPKSIGARDPKYASLLGLLLFASKYNGSLEDNRRGVVPLSRTAGKKEKKRHIGADEDAL